MRKLLTASCLLALAMQSATAENERVISEDELRITAAAREKIGQASIVHLAIRTDGVIGGGTEADPYDGSTAARFDALMAGFYRFFNGRSLIIRLGAGTFETRTRDSYGPNVSGNFGAQHWLHANWTLQGSGMFATEIRNANPDGNGVTMFNSTGGTWGGPEEGNITIRDLTLNPRKSAFRKTKTYEPVLLEGDGNAISGKIDGEPWPKGAQIRIANATDRALNGVHSLTATEGNRFRLSSVAIGKGTAKVEHSGQWTAVRLNGGNLKLDSVRAIDCGSSAPEIECWPLWLGSGDGNVIDQCVVEHCSGFISAIAIFPDRSGTIRNSRVDGSGCDSVLGISATGSVLHNQIRNTTYAIYADTFAHDQGILIDGNTIENSAEGGIDVRPNGHHSGIIITNNIVHGGKASVGIAVSPMSVWTDQGWADEKGEKIWIDDVIITNNTIGEKRLQLVQVRGGRIINNTADSGEFRFMDEVSLICRDNLTVLGASWRGLEKGLPATQKSSRHRARRSRRDTR